MELLDLGNTLINEIRRNVDIGAMEDEVRNQNSNTPLGFVVLLTDKIQQSLGIVGFIDAAGETGMSHLGWIGF